MNEDTTPEQTTFEAFWESLGWRVVRREEGQVIVERVDDGKQIKIQEVSNENI
jgi:hypothetical protein